MEAENSSPKEHQTLRQRAEETLRRAGPSIRNMPLEDMQMLAHELQLREIELKLQNDELRKMQSRLEASDRRYRDLYDFAPVAYVTLDREGCIRDMNRSAADLLGLEKRRATGTALSLYLAPHSIKVFRKHLRQSLQNRTRETCELEFNPPKGGSFFACLESLVVEDSNVQVEECRTAIIDMTERKQAEQSMFENHRRLNQIIDLVPHFIFAKDHQGRFLLVNRAVATVYDTTPQEMIGKTDADYARRGEEAAQFTENDLQVIESGQAKFIPEEQITDANGQVRFLQTMKIPFTESGSDTPAVLGVSTDITERKQLEDQLRRSQKLQAVSQLAGGIAHGFNNLLTVIIGNVDIVVTRMRRRSPADDPLIRALMHIHEAASKGAELSRQLLTFSRPEAGTPQTINLNSLLHEMEPALREVVGERIGFEMLLNSDPPFVRADPGQVRQMIMNLVLNARDAIPVEGTLTVETSAVHLDADYVAHHPQARTGPHAVLAVTDTGVGMDTETLEHLFEPFFTKKPLDQVAGLGLSVAHGIVKQVGGHIAVASQPDKGSCFRVHLPAIRRQDNAASGSEPGAKRPGPETVLVCEDDNMVRRTICQVLEDTGYSVLSVDNGRRALAMANEHADSIHLVITDVVMPQMNGRELARALADSQPDMPVLLISGYSPNSVKQGHADQRETFEFLSKPFKPEFLVKRVRELIARGQAARERPKNASHLHT